MASMVCLSHPLPTSHLLYPSPSTHDRRFSCFLRQRRCCKLAFKHASPSFPSTSRRRLGFSLDTPQGAKLQIIASLAVNNANSGTYHSPLLARLAENSGQGEPRKVYADEYELNYDVYASMSMAEYVPPPPPPIPFGGPWEEYYDELVGEDYVPKQEKPTSSLIKYLEELNQKMADDDAKAGKPPRKMFPNRDLDLSFDEGPRFLKPRGEVARYYPSPPVVAPVAWVLEGGATPYIEPPPPPPPPAKEEVATSADTLEAPTTSPASDTPTAAPLSAQGTGPGVGISSAAPASTAPISAVSFGQGGTSTYQGGVGAQRRPAQESQPYEPILLRNRVPPANQNIPEPYQPILLKNRVPPVSPANQNNPAQQGQPYQPVTNQASQSNLGSSPEPYQPILLKNRVPPVSPVNQNNPVQQQSQPWPPVSPTNQTSPVQQSQPWPPVPLTNQSSPVQQSQPYQPSLMNSGVPSVSPTRPGQDSQPYWAPSVRSPNQSGPVQESQPSQPILFRNRVPSVPPANKSSPVQENRNPPVMQSSLGQENQPLPSSIFRDTVSQGGPANLPAQETAEQRPVLNQGTGINNGTSFDTGRFPQTRPIQGGRDSGLQYTPQSGPTGDTSGRPLYPQSRPMPMEQAQDTSRPLFPQTRPFEQPRDSRSVSPPQQSLEQTTDYNKQWLPQTRPFGEISDSSRPSLSSQVGPFEGASDSIGTLSQEKSGQWFSSPQSKVTGETPSQFYEPKEGDVVVGAVISGDDWKLDLEIGAEQPAVMAFRDFQSFPSVDLDGSFFSLPSSDDVSPGGFVAPVGRSLVVKGNDDSAVSSEYIENGAVFVAEVQGRTYAQDGPAILSCRSLARRFTWNRIKQLMQMGQPIELEILQFNDGGLSGYFEGLRAFLPRSELVQRPESTASLEGYVGKVIRVAVVQADEDASNIIISELKYWMHSNLQVGTVHHTTVTRIYPYGIQVEIKNTRIRGFVHISNMSKEYVRSVTDLFQEGDTATVMLIKGRNPQQVSFSIADLESEAGLIFRDKTRVYQEAEDMASKFREDLSAEERQIFGLQAVGGIEESEAQSLSIANRQWLHLGSDSKANSVAQ